MSQISAIVLAAGQGKRMKSDIPKVLHPISGLPMVLLVVNTLKKAGIKKIVVVVGHSGEKVRKILPEDVKVVDQKYPKGTGHAVKCCERMFKGYKGNVLIACADMPLITAGTVRKFIKEHDKNSVSSTIMTGLVCNPEGYGRIVRDENDKPIQICEDKDGSKEIKAINEINSGMYCFKTRDLFGVLRSINKKNKQNEFYLTDSVHLLIKKGLEISTFPAKDCIEIFGINSRRDLAFAQKVMNKRILDMHMDNGVSVTDPDSTFIDMRVRIGRDTVIRPYTVIDGNVIIGRHCEVGPFAHLRDKTILKDGAEVGNFVEVKKSVIGKHTKAKHLTYLGDTQIGQKVNIGAGTITANYDGKNKHKTVIGNRVFIGSHTTLVAPIKIGDGAVTGAGAVVLRNRNVPKNTVVVGMPARTLKKKNNEMDSGC